MQRPARWPGQPGPGFYRRPGEADDFRRTPGETGMLKDESAWFPSFESEGSWEALSIPQWSRDSAESGGFCELRER